MTTRTKKYDDLTIDEVQKIVQDSSATKVINSLIKKGCISVYETMNELYKPKREKFVLLHANYQSEESLKSLFNKLDKKPKLLNILLAYLNLVETKQQASQKELLQLADASTTQLKTLVDKGFFIIQLIETDRIVFKETQVLVENKLSDLQHDAVVQIENAFADKKPVLLKGVTGSGKTHVYFELIRKCIASQKQTLYLLPEIALTAQIIRKLQSVFGNTIGVYHSRFSNDERVEIWRKVQHGEHKIIIGARSSLLLPFRNLGLVIVDEEHDSSYKQQEPSPRYHARDAAVVLAHQMDARIILGSATPSLESFYNAIEKKYTLVTLNARYGSGELPCIELIDLKQQAEDKKMKGVFSVKMLDAIKETIENRKQVILFQNRRGYAPMIMCGVCAWIPQCKYCDVSLTYHKATDQLHCHYCGSKSAVVKICAACGHHKLVAKSFGTEKIEEEIKSQFPNARVQRFDWDSLRNKNKHTEIIRQFEKQQIDILIGTQMVVKGLDFEHVNLVGVVGADGMLSYPDFRVNERTFQLLEQVGGRAGRKNNEGKVMIQLYKVKDETIACVKTHDYATMYRNEMAMRKEFQYPPFTRLIRITLRHRYQHIVQEAAQFLAQAIINVQKTIIFGPAEPSIGRIRNLYIQEILLKTNREGNNPQVVKDIVAEKIILLNTTKNFSQVRVILDVDPY